MAFFHPATERDLKRFREFEDSLEFIDERLTDRSDVIFNWTQFPAEPCAGGKRVLLVERSSHALAWVVGDGERFGKVVAVEDGDVADIVRRYGFHTPEEPVPCDPRGTPPR
ncbi:MAG: hypothetical protein V4850_06735 [Myxococcota bacterium]